MDPSTKSEANNGAPGDGASYRLANPFRYSTVAGILAATITGGLDFVLFDRGSEHAVKTGLSAGATWFLVVLGLAMFVRVRTVRSDD